MQQGSLNDILTTPLKVKESKTIGPLFRGSPSVEMHKKAITIKVWSFYLDQGDLTGQLPGAASSRDLHAQVYDNAIHSLL